MADSPIEALAGIQHLEALSQILHRSIEIFNEGGSIKFMVGSDDSNEKPIKIQFHRHKKHFTLCGQIEPHARGKNSNMCLYNCIADHTGVDPDILKSLTQDFLRRTVLPRRLPGGDLCLGGASYRGEGRSDASWYLDSSQDVRGYRHARPGHPRHRASNPAGVGVEAASRAEGFKTGFDSYEEQDYAAHYALQSGKARDAMDSLDGGKSRVVTHVTARELRLPRPVGAARWLDGERGEGFAVQTVVLVLQHHEGQYANARAPVHIQTFYPQLPS